MGCMLRSDPMSYCDMYLQPEASFDIMSKLGDMGCVQFIDMTPDIQPYARSYISEVCRCSEMERRLRFMGAELEKDKIPIIEPLPVRKAETLKLEESEEPRAIQPSEMVVYENLLEKWEVDLLEMSQNQTNLLNDISELKEMSYILTHVGPLIGSGDARKDSKISWGGYGDIIGPSGRLVVMTGVVNRAKSFHFEMMLWRVALGNIYYRQAAEDQISRDPKGAEIRKVGFLAVFQGEQLNRRIEKVVQGFRAKVYPCPQTELEREETMIKIKHRMVDLDEIVKKTRYHRCKALRTVARQWVNWMTRVRKTKAIYHNMNLFNLELTKNCLIGQCWVPTRDLPNVQRTLEHCSYAKKSSVSSFISKTAANPVLVPPTFNRTNKFTAGFQALINAYGDSKYEELNPGLYTIITFPFLFAVMFGDVGHAIILVIFATWMIMKEKEFGEQKSTNEIWNIFFHGRYVILLLGLFSMFTGFIFNDLFSKCVIVHRSLWRNQVNESLIESSTLLEIDPAGPLRTPYIFGVDPLWTLAKNKIVVENSIKMKTSIIIGVVHMMFGIMLSLLNYVHFKTYYAIFVNFIPELLFLTCLFAWLVVLIYVKWFLFSAQHLNPLYGSACAPQILILFIDMVLMRETAPVADNCKAYLFNSQPLIQKILVIVAMSCIPVMLFGGPIFTYKYNKKREKKIWKSIRKTQFRRYQQRESIRDLEEQAVIEVSQYHVPFCDLMISQAVHTIEFVLSTISHTASYLRLWALSLAHAQLSEMLWMMVLSKLALRDHSYMGIPKLFIIFAIWASFTFAILVVMEGLSAFLHTLRLHWVEFMSKFYHGGGQPFRPFSFDALLKTEEKPDNACKPQKRGKMKVSASQKQMIKT